MNHNKQFASALGQNGAHSQHNRLVYSTNFLLSSLKPKIQPHARTIVKPAKVKAQG